MEIAIGLIVLWLFFMAFIWFKGGLWKGRKFGNQIANHLGIPKNLFHAMLDNGVNGPSLQLLAMLQGANISIERASVELGPSLEKGAIALEEKYGSQEEIKRARPVISKLVREWEALQVERRM